MERETGLEPAAFSLGISVSIENKEQWRSRGCIQIQRNQQLLPSPPLNGVKMEWNCPPSPFVLIQSTEHPLPLTDRASRSNPDRAHVLHGDFSSTWIVSEWRQPALIAIRRARVRLG